MLMIWTVLQLSFAFHARNLARAAAQDAATEAARNGSGPWVIDDVAHQIIGDTTLIHNVEVTASDDLDQITVVVTGDVVSIVPFLHLTARGSASAPIERFVPQPER